MPIETKEVIEFAEYLGYKPAEIKDLAELKTKFEGEFVRTSLINEEFEPVKKLIGKAYGSLEVDLQKVAKTNDVNVDEIEGWKDAKMKDKVKLLASKLIESKNTQIEELTKKAGQGNDEKVTELTKAKEKLERKFSDTDELLKTVSREYEDFKVSAANQLKSIKLDTLKASELSKIPFIGDVTTLQKEGYNALVAKELKFDLDESGSKLIVMNSEGKQIPNTKVSGTFLSPEDALISIAAREKLLKLNEVAGTKKEQAKKVTETTTTSTTGSQTRVLGKRLVED